VPIDPGTQVGRFRIVRLVAQGGMAEVYRAEQELTTGIFRPAALKVIRPEYAASEDFREMFLDEARTACPLSHPNIVHIYEVGEAEGLLYMGMELVAGESLATVGKELATYFVEPAATPNVTVTQAAAGGDIVLSDAGAAFATVKVSAGTTLGATASLNSDTLWCVGVSNPDGKQKTYKYSAAGGLQPGVC
jgi:hypothetical protein